MDGISKVAAIFLASFCIGSGAIASEMVDRHIFSPEKDMGKPEGKASAESPKAKELKKTLNFTGVVIAPTVKYAMIKDRRAKRDEQVPSLRREGDEIQDMTIKEIGSNYLVLSDKNGDVKLSLYQGDKSRPAPPPEPKPEPEEKKPAEKKPGDAKAAKPAGAKGTGNKGAAKKAPTVIKPATGKTAPKAGSGSNPFLDAMKRAKESGESATPSANPFLDAIRRAKGN